MRLLTYISECANAPQPHTLARYRGCDDQPAVLHSYTHARTRTRRRCPANLHTQLTHIQTYTLYFVCNAPLDLRSGTRGQGRCCGLRFFPSIWAYLCQVTDAMAVAHWRRRRLSLYHQTREGLSRYSAVLWMCVCVCALISRCLDLLNGKCTHTLIHFGDDEEMR